MGNNAQIEITPEMLRTAAQQIMRQRERLVEQIGIANTEITNLANGGWRSAAGDRLRERFNTLRNRILGTYPQAMTDYENFLTQTATDYENADAATKAKINNLFNLGQA